jgi:hypothetical protein
MGLDDEMNTAFQESKKDLLYPPIDSWDYDDKLSTGYLDMSGDRTDVKINEEFAEQLSPEGLKGFNDHELGHYTYHPFDVATSLKEINWLQDRENAQQIKMQFDDIVNNAHLIVNGKNDIAHLYRDMYEDEDEIPLVGDTILKYYEEISGEDFGSNFDPNDEKQQEFLEELKKIDFLDTDRMEWNIKRFADVYDKYREEQDMDGDGQGDGQGQLGDGGMGNDTSIDTFDEDEIRRGMKDVAQDLDPDEYRDLADGVQERIDEEMDMPGAQSGGEGEEEAGYGEDGEDGGQQAVGEEGEEQGSSGQQGDGSGIGEGRDFMERMMEKADVSYYEMLASNYSLEVRGREEAKGGMYPSELRDYELSDPIEQWDPIQSKGSVKPGIAKSWEFEQAETHGEKEDVPDAVIMIDSSGSMPDPTQKKSFAVLGGFCAANSYIENGSDVAVANFSDDTRVQEFTRDKDEIYDKLVEYQNGGTSLEVDAVEELEEDRPVHSIMITDAGLHNIDDIDGFFQEYDETKRTIIWVNQGGMGSNRGTFDDLVSISDEFHGYEVAETSDIPGIVLGDI